MYRSRLFGLFCSPRTSLLHSVSAHRYSSMHCLRGSVLLVRGYHTCAMNFLWGLTRGQHIRIPAATSSSTASTAVPTQSASAPVAVSTEKRIALDTNILHLLAYAKLSKQPGSRERKLYLMRLTHKHLTDGQFQEVVSKCLELEEKVKGRGVVGVTALSEYNNNPAVSFGKTTSSPKRNSC